MHDRESGIFFFSLWRIPLVVLFSLSQLQIFGQTTIGVLFDQAYQLELSDPDSAIQVYKQGHDLAVRLDSSDAQANALYYIGLVQMNQGRFDSSTIYLDEARQFFADIGDKSGLIKSLNSLANIHNYRGENEAAVNKYHEAITHARDIKDTLNQVRCLNNLATIYNQTGKYEQSFQILRESELLANIMGEPGYLGDIHNNYSTNYEAVDSLDLALYHCRRAISYYRQSGDQAYEALALLNLTMYILKSDTMELDSVDIALQRSRTLLEELNAPALEAHYYKQLALYHLKNGAFSKAEAAAVKSLEFHGQFDLKLSGVQIYEVLYSIMKASGRLSEAIGYMEKFVESKDSLLSAESSHQLQELEAKYQSAYKDNQIAQQEVLLVKQAAQRNLWIGVIVGLILLALFLYYRNWQSTKLASARIENLEKEQKLIALDYMVQGQEEERRRIAQDLHDGLGGLLASARLQMRSIHREIEKFGELNLFGQAEKMIDNACNEVRRIAHDMMPGSLVDLGLTDAVEDLAQQINSRGALKVKVNSSIEAKQLEDIQKLNLYRIIQEAVNNTIKHAGASQIEILLELMDADHLRLMIRDNGQGFDLAKLHSSSGLGLQNIRSRVSYLNGELDIDTARGTTYEIVIPLQK